MGEGHISSTHTLEYTVHTEKVRILNSIRSAPSMKPRELTERTAKDAGSRRVVAVLDYENLES